MRAEQDMRQSNNSSERFCRYEATERNSIVQHILVPPGLTLNNSTFCSHSVCIFSLNYL